MRDDDLSEEVNALIQGYVEGVLTPAECRRLRELIRRHPRLARLLTENLHLDEEIRGHVPARPIRQRSRRLRIVRRRPAEHPSGAWITTASLAAAGLLLFLSFAGQDGQRSRNSQVAISKVDRGLLTLPPEVEPPLGQPPPRADRPSAESPPLTPRKFDAPIPTEKAKPDRVEEPRGLSMPGTTVAAPPALPPAPKIVARVQEAKGAFLTSKELPKEISGECDLKPGQGVQTGESGRAVLVYEDGTRVQLESSTKIRHVESDLGKLLRVDRGAVSADVANQSVGAPAIFLTQQGKATVMGTSLRIAIEPNSTRLQVFMGQVQFASKSGATAMVVGGNQVTSTGSAITQLPLSAESMLKGLRSLTISFGPSARKLQPGCMIDSGQIYDETLGYGWDRIVSSGTSRGMDPNDLKSSFVSGGSKTKTETWRMKVPKGKYEVSVWVGGPGFDVLDQGPHMVVVEGKALFKGRKTQNGQFMDESCLINVSDGKLTVSIGGHGTDAMASDATDDTVINYLMITRK